VPDVFPDKLDNLELIICSSETALKQAAIVKSA
jgi:hypothetical protein